MMDLTKEEKVQIKAALSVAGSHLDDPRLRDALERLTALVKLCHTDDLEARIKAFGGYSGVVSFDAASYYAPYIPLQQVSVNTQAPIIQQITLQAKARSIGPQWGFELPDEDIT